MKLAQCLAALSAALPLTLQAVVAADFTDKDLQRKFEQGTLQLQHSWFGKGVAGGAELNRLYNQGVWQELVQGVVSKQFVSDLYYFYLGAAAEALGHRDAALVYYLEAKSAYQRRDTCNFGLDSCYTVPMPATLFSRIDALQNAEKARDITIAVRSSHGHPVANARVEASGERKGPACTTNESGSCTLRVMLKPKEALAVVTSHEGMFVQRDAIAAGAAGAAVTMRPYRDMICADMQATASPAQLAAVERQVELVALRAQVDGTNLNDHGICTSIFKKANYLSFSLTNEVTFNENKLTSYMIGATIFDEAVKKMLLHMVVTGSDLKVDGYLIRVASTKRNFGDTGTIAKPVNFDFYFPKQLVEKYQNKDISGQQLLDGSVVLLNDDRVDLKLQ